VRQAKMAQVRLEPGVPERIEFEAAVYQDLVLR